MRFVSSSRLAVVFALALVAPMIVAAKDKEPRRTVLMTERDEAVAGSKGAAQAASQIGVYDDPKLAKYVDGLGRKLLRGVPQRPFPFQFQIVDQVEPNAFALPGGYVFVSRGLLALVNTEDELACVIGHEIGHVLGRHAVAQQAIARTMTPFTSGWRNAAEKASYSRDMEREADAEGQQLCAAAGYDPRSLYTFLQTLHRVEPLRARVSGGTGFLDTHPSSVERAAAASVRASELRWKRDPARADGRAALLAQIDGLPLGPRPDGGVFSGDWFLQPALNFQVRFPSRWKTSNTNAMVGASSPTGSAIVFLTAGPPTATGREAADQWLAEAQKDQKITVVESKPASSGTISTWRLLVESRDRRGSMSSYVTAIPYGPYTFMVTGMSPSRVAKQELPRTLEVARSFGPLSAEARASIKGMRLDVVKAQAGETPFAIASRTGSKWDGGEVAAYNGVGEDLRFGAGDLVKVARSEAYADKRR